MKKILKFRNYLLILILMQQQPLHKRVKRETVFILFSYPARIEKKGGPSTSDLYAHKSTSIHMLNSIAIAFGLMN